METCPCSEGHSINVYGRVLMDVQRRLKFVLEMICLLQALVALTSKNSLRYLFLRKCVIKVRLHFSWSQLVLHNCVTYCTEVFY
jgi:hypothetical protein